MYADTLMIWNPGQLPAAWTVEKLTQKHSSQPFNPDIANVFFRAGEIEAWGRGIERMFGACRAAGFPAPVMEYEATGLWVKFPFSPEVIEASGKTSVKTSVKASVKTSVKASVKSSVKSSVKGSAKSSVKTSEALRDLLRQNPQMTLAEVAAAVGRSVRAVEMASAKLAKAGKLRFVGPQKGGRWEVTP